MNESEKAVLSILRAITTGHYLVKLEAKVVHKQLQPNVSWIGLLHSVLRNPPQMVPEEFAAQDFHLVELE